jgi:hypothetical protein
MERASGVGITRLCAWYGMVKLSSASASARGSWSHYDSPIIATYSYAYRAARDCPYLREPTGMFDCEIRTGILVMAHYYFHIRNYGLDREDLSGVELRDLDTALGQAIATARCMMSAGLRDGRLLLAPWIDIASEDGEVLARLPFADAIDTVYLETESETPLPLQTLTHPTSTHDDDSVRLAA